MKKMKTTIKIILLLLCLGMLPHLKAQVTIGVLEKPAEGALLQLKDIVAAATGSKNAKKGLLMPRVFLKNDTTLEPMFPNATAGEKMQHAGLIVYNLTDQTPLKKGIMVWNGLSWGNVKVKSKDVDPEVKKLLYESPIPLENKSISNNSIEVSMDLSPGMHYQASPRFRVTPSYAPAGSDSEKYLYHIIRYWTGEDPAFPAGEYSADLDKRSFTEQDYSTHQYFRVGFMTTQERDEVWLLDENNDDIFHVQFFVLGNDAAGINKLYAVFVERF
jgi:hypothetical protein